jgi:L-asparaginase II
MEPWIDLASLERAGLPESLHRGAWVLTDAAGRVLASRGEPSAPIWSRSAVKAFQALPIVALGLLDELGLGDEHLAVICGSHGGEARHRRLVGEILAAAGLDESHLDCGYHRPFDGVTAREQIREGLSDSPLYHNCSGKHAGMLLLQRALGGELGDYLDPSAPGQALVQDCLTAFAGGAKIAVGIEGCNSPSYRLPLAALARAFAGLAAGDPPVGLPRPELPWAAALARVTAAQAAHPELIGGRRRRLDTELIRAGGGELLAKSGAEGVQIMAFRQAGLGFALKVADGADRVVGALCCALLAHWRILDEKALASLAFWSDAVQINAAGRRTGTLEISPSALPDPDDIDPFASSRRTPR